jgi:hypothetical protein
MSLKSWESFPFIHFTLGFWETKQSLRKQWIRKWKENEKKRKLTIPILRWDENLPRMGRSAGASFDFAAFGGIVSERERERPRFLGFCSKWKCVWCWALVSAVGMNPVKAALVLRTPKGSKPSHVPSRWANACLWRVSPPKQIFFFFFLYLFLCVLYICVWKKFHAN